MLSVFIYLGKHTSDEGSVYLSKIKSIRTDFSEGDSYQKVVRFNFDGSLLVTGGCDKVLRVWKVNFHTYFQVIVDTCQSSIMSLQPAYESISIFHTNSEKGNKYV